MRPKTASSPKFLKWWRCAHSQSLAFSTIFLLSFGASCQKSHENKKKETALIAQVITYPLKNQQYVILVVQEGNMKNSEAKLLARQKAAQITLSNNYRYFTILSEEEIKTMKTTTPQPEAPENIYQELIVEKDFSRNHLEQDDSISIQSYPAIRLTIHCSHGKPSFNKSFDANDLKIHKENL